MFAWFRPEFPPDARAKPLSVSRRPRWLALEVLLGRRLFLELEQAADAFSENFANLSRRDKEELTPLVDQVYLPVSEHLVELAFKGDSVVAKEQGVRVERER